jgi:two-component system response regulator HydG
VGGEKTLAVDVRLISATNRDLKEEVGQGKFREDLFYRLHVVPIELPPLRARGGDIARLAAHLAAKICRRMNRPPRDFEPAALDRLAGYPWPGNVRELENVIERALVLGKGERIAVEDFPPLARSEDKGQDRAAAPELPASGGIDLNATLENLERQYIAQALERTGGNKSRTARLLGLKTSALYYKLEKYGLG